MNLKLESLKLAWKVEGISVLLTGLIIALVMLPIFRNIPDFRFLVFNIAIIASFFTIVRYIFLLRFTPFSRFAPVKTIFIFLTIPLAIYLIDGLAEFQFYLDDEGTYDMVSHLEINKQVQLSKYIRSEIVFFGVGAILATLIFPIRMIISLWKVRNRNKV